VAVLGIPFYLMQEAEAAAALRTILIEEFDLTPTSVEERGSSSGVPAAFALLPNYPNPFVESTQIRFIMPQAGRVKIEVFDLLGKQVATLIDGALEAGRHEATLRQKLERNGVYFYRMTVRQGGRVVHQQTQKLLVLR
jgi:hypothetical protein